MTGRLMSSLYHLPLWLHCRIKIKRKIRFGFLKGYSLAAWKRAVFALTAMEVRHKWTVLPSEKTDIVYHFSTGSDLLTRAACSWSAFIQCSDF